MTTLKEEALSYQAPQKLNVADMDFISVDTKLDTITGKNLEGKDYSYKAHIEGTKEYYVPNVVIAKIQEILKLKPDAQKFKVKKTGSGLSTKYFVDVLM